MSPAAPNPPGPSRALVVIVLGVLAAFLVWPVHVPYQAPDQDWPPLWALLEMVRGGWAPWNFQYPAALTNLLRMLDGLTLALGRLGGEPRDAVDLLAHWMESPWVFRVPPRLVAMAGGVLSLVAVLRLGALAADRATGLAAAVLLGTAAGFVREHHHGMWDAPAATAALWSLVMAGTYALRPAPRALVAAGALAGLACAFKQTAAPVVVGLPLAAWAAGSAAARGRDLVLAGLAAAAAVFAASPQLLLEPGRFLAHQAVIRAALFAPRPPGGPPAFVGHDLWTALGLALGWALLASAAIGGAVALRRRQGVLLPLGGFALAYAALAARSHFVLNRYTLLLAPAVAVFAAHGVRRVLPGRLALVAVALLAGLGLARTLPYLRLLGVEDTRVAAARWLRGHLRPEAEVVWPGNVLLGGYVGPDLARPLPLERLPAARREAIAQRVPPPFPRRRLYLGAPQPLPDCDGCAAALAPWAGRVVITAEHPDPVFRDAVSSPVLVDALARHALPLADFPIEAAPGVRVYDPGDMNFAPLVGAGTLLRPGPRLRLWWVRPAVPAAAASPFLPGREPPTE